MFHTLTYTGGGSASQRCLLQQPHNLNCRQKIGAGQNHHCATHTQPRLLEHVAAAVPDQTPETLSGRHTTQLNTNPRTAPTYCCCCCCCCWLYKLQTTLLEGPKEICRGSTAPAEPRSICNNKLNSAHTFTHRDMQLQPCRSYSRSAATGYRNSAHKRACRLPHTRAAAVTVAVTAGSSRTRLLLLLLLLLVLVGSCCRCGCEQACMSQQGFR
jgi:hypothetical protein